MPTAAGRKGAGSRARSGAEAINASAKQTLQSAPLSKQHYGRAASAFVATSLAAEQPFGRSRRAQNKEELFRQISRIGSIGSTLRVHAAYPEQLADAHLPDLSGRGGVLLVVGGVPCWAACVGASG